MWSRKELRVVESLPAQVLAQGVHLFLARQLLASVWEAPHLLGLQALLRLNYIIIIIIHCCSFSLIHQTEPSANPTAPSHVLRLTVLQEVGVGTRISSDWWSVRFL